MRGQLVAQVFEVTANKVSKYQTESLNIRVNYTWKGPAKTITGYGVVTQKTAVNYFDEIGSTKKSFSHTLPESVAAAKSGYFDIVGLPLSGCAVKTDYGVKVHIDDVDEWGALSCLDVMAAAGEISISSFTLS